MKRPIIQQKPGVGAAMGGWRQPVGQLWTQLVAEMHALKARVEAEEGAPLGVPAVYQGVKVFEPTGNRVTVDLPGVGAIPAVVVVPDGVTYEIPIYFPGPGVFVARTMEVNIYKKVCNLVEAVPANFGQQAIFRQFTTGAALNDNDDGDIRTSRFDYSVPGGGTQWPVSGRGDGAPAIQFWWNLADTKSGRFYADDLLPQQALMPMSPSATGFVQEIQQSVPYPIDGGRMHFDAPWLVERDGQFRFLFRPTTLCVQSITASGQTDMPITVQVEFHGERYETLQDALRSGAMTRPVRGEEE